MREEIQYCEQNLLMLLVIYEIISVIYVLSLPHWTQTLGLFPIFLSSCMVFKNKRGSWGNLKIFSHLPASHLPTPLPLAFQQPAPVSLFFFLFFFFFKHQQLLSQKWLIVSCLRLYLFTLGQGGHFLWLFTALPPLHHLFSPSKQHQHSPLPLPLLRIAPYTLHSRRKGQSASTAQPHITRAQPTRQTVAWGRSPVNIP